MSTEARLQFTLTHLFGVTAYIAFALGLAIWLELPAIAVHLACVLVGWIMCRFLHGHVGAVIISLFGIDLLIWSGISWAYFGDDDFLDFRLLAVMLGTVATITGLGLFLWQGSRRQPFWRTQSWLGVVMLFVLLGWWAVMLVLGPAVVAQRQARETAANNAAMAKAVAQIEALRQQLGRVPSRAEVADLLDEPLPYFRWQSFTTQIHYQQIRKDQYQLSYCYWDIFVYDSATPQKGWYRIPF